MAASRGLTLWFKRAKSFVAVVNNGTRKWLAQPSNTPQHGVPFWVADTTTFKQGILDESIVNLTPPHLMPGYVYPATAAEAPTPEKAPTTSTEPSDATTGHPAAEDEEYEEQKEVPKAPFGGQQMVPTNPAAKTGLQGAGSKKQR